MLLELHKRRKRKEVVAPSLRDELFCWVMKQPNPSRVVLFGELIRFALSPEKVSSYKASIILREMLGEELLRQTRVSGTYAAHTPALYMLTPKGEQMARSVASRLQNTTKE